MYRLYGWSRTNYSLLFENKLLWPVSITVRRIQVYPDGVLPHFVTCHIFSVFSSEQCIFLTNKSRSIIIPGYKTKWAKNLIQFKRHSV